MEILGWVGTALVIVAYVPQIAHLLVARCAWGITISTWLMWLIASSLLFIYCIQRNELLLGLVQAVNGAAILLTIVLVRSSHKICPAHMTESNTQ